MGPKQPSPVVVLHEVPVMASLEASARKNVRASWSIPLIGVAPNGRAARSTFWIRSVLLSTSPIGAVGDPKGTIRPSHGGAAALRAPTSTLAIVAQPCGAPFAQEELVTQLALLCQLRK